MITTLSVEFKTIAVKNGARKMETHLEGTRIKWILLFVPFHSLSGRGSRLHSQPQGPV